jgi:hypothetical protein
MDGIQQRKWSFIAAQLAARPAEKLPIAFGTAVWIRSTT